jgi:hypothetical protein
MNQVKASEVLEMSPEAMVAAYSDDTAGETWQAIRMMARGEDPADAGLDDVIRVSAPSRGIDQALVTP